MHEWMYVDDMRVIISSIESKNRFFFKLIDFIFGQITRRKRERRVGLFHAHTYTRTDTITVVRTHEHPPTHKHFLPLYTPPQTPPLPLTSRPFLHSPPPLHLSHRPPKPQPHLHPHPRQAALTHHSLLPPIQQLAHPAAHAPTLTSPLLQHHPSGRRARAFLPPPEAAKEARKPRDLQEWRKCSVRLSCGRLLQRRPSERFTLDAALGPVAFCVVAVVVVVFCRGCRGCCVLLWFL